MEAAPAPLAISSEELRLNSCSAEALAAFANWPLPLARTVVEARDARGGFESLEQILQVPGITPAHYQQLTGESAPGAPAPQAAPSAGVRSGEGLPAILGLSAGQEISLRTVIERIALWPDIMGCLLGQTAGWKMLGSVPPPFDAEALLAFAPKLFTLTNQSLQAIGLPETDGISLEVHGQGCHWLRTPDLMLVIISRQPHLPERYGELLTQILGAMELRQVV